MRQDMRHLNSFENHSRFAENKNTTAFVGTTDFLSGKMLIHNIKYEIKILYLRQDLNT